MEILKREHRNNSHRSIEDIKRQQFQHRKDILQPRIEGKVNTEYVKEFGTKSLNISERDMRDLYKTDSSLARTIDEKRRNQNS